MRGSGHAVGRKVRIKKLQAPPEARLVDSSRQRRVCLYATSKPFHLSRCLRAVGLGAVAW
jgi:hypothetical protein